MKACLELLGYYWKLKDVAKLLKQWVKKKAKIGLTNESINSLEAANEILTNLGRSPQFHFAISELSKRILRNNRLDGALGIVLSRGSIKFNRFICYTSRTFSDTERKYSKFKKELVAFIYAIKQFRLNLYGQGFTLYTDHKPLIWLWFLK